MNKEMDFIFKRYMFSYLFQIIKKIIYKKKLLIAFMFYLKKQATSRKVYFSEKNNT